MDPLRIAVRALFVYVYMLALIRLSGKRTVRQVSVPSFVLAVIIGDLLDDAIWADVPMSEFVVASGTLVFVNLLVSLDAFARGSRVWHRPAAGAERTP